MRKGLYYLLIICYLLSACGRKAPPDLKVYEKPERVDNLRAIHNEKGLILSWSYPESRVEIKGFIILRSGERDFERRGYVEGKGRPFSFIDLDFKTRRHYRYRVIAESIKGITGEASEISVTPLDLPEPPKNIRFSVKTDSIELSWDDKQGCYNIYRAIEGGAYSLLNQRPVCEGLFVDRIPLGKTASYTIRSLVTTDIVNEGPASEPIIVGLDNYIPSPPSDLRIIIGNGKVFLLWKESAEIWTKGYRIYRKVEGEGDYYPIGKSTIPAFTDSAVKEIEGRRVYYMIKALGPLAESEPLYGDMIYLIPK